MNREGAAAELAALQVSRASRHGPVDQAISGLSLGEIDHHYAGWRRPLFLSRFATVAVLRYRKLQPLRIALIKEAKAVADRPSIFTKTSRISEPCLAGLMLSPTTA